MAELRYTYLLDVKDLASRQVAQANARITGSVDRANAAMARQGTVAENSARKVQTAGARQAAEWKQVQRAALSADRAVAQAATQSAQTVSRSVERQVAALRKQNQSYAQIARAQKAAGISSRETAAAVEQAKARELRAYESTAAGAARSTGRVRGMLRGQLQQVRSFATGMVAAFGVFKAAQFVGDSVKQVGELARGTVKLSAVTGMDARTASQWLVIAKQRGLAARQLNQSFITLEKNQVKGAAGTKLQAAAFEKLGITQQDLKKLGTEQLIERVADGFQRLGPGAQRAALAQQLFARGGQALIATLAGGGQKIRDMRKVIDEYGASLDAKGVKNAMRLVTAQRQLNLAMLGIKVSLGQALIPLLARGAQALSTFILQIRQGKGPGGDFRRVVEGLAAGARDVVAFVKPAVTALAGFVRQHPGIVKVAGAIVAVGVAVRALRFAGAISGVNSLLRVLGVLGRTRAGQAAVAAVTKAFGGLAGRLAGPLAKAGSVILSTITGAGVSAGARARDSISRRLGGVRLPNLAGKFGTWGRLLGTAAGIAAGAAIVGQISKALDDMVLGANPDRRSGGGSSGSGKIDSLLPLGDVTRKLGDWAKGLFGRTGGIASAQGFRRYQHGGLVPAMLSPGELIVHGNAGMVVPGPPVAADTVPMLLPTGSAVLTGHGQQLLAQGATISQAVAAQAPHFAKGGFVKVGATVYNDPPPGAYGGSLSMGYAELGTARRTDGGGTGRGWLARALGRRGELPENYPLRVSRRPDGAGRVAILRKRDRGYGQGGDGRTSDPYYAIDIWRDAWSNLGINGSFKGPVWVQPTTGKLPASTPGTGGGARSVSGLAQAMSRRVGRSVKRAGLVDDAFGSGFAQGEAGLTRQRLRYRPDTAARDIAAAYRLPASKTVSVPGAKATASASGAGNYGGARGPMVTWEGKRMRSWLAHALAYARDKGWRGSVNQGLRSHAEQVRLWNGAPGNGLVRGVSVARPGQSRHESGNAVDVSPPGPGLLRYFRGYRGMRPKWMGERDRVHYSDTGHRKGGWIGGVRPIALRAGTGSVGGPVQVGRVIRQETTGPGIPAYGRRLQDAVERALTWQAGTFEKLNTAVQAAAERKLGALRNRLQAAVRKGGTEATVKRLQAALDLVDKELGRRAGLLARRVTQRAASADRAQARSEIGLRLAGVDPESAPGLAARLRVEAAKGKGLHRTARDLEGELRLARRAHDLDRITDLKTQIADNQTAILESRASQRELARARQQAQLDARTAFAAAMTDIATSRVSLAQTGLQRVELEQRLAGTYDTGGRARADYITSQVIPQLQSERDQIKAQGIQAMRQNNAELARAMRQAWEEKGNDILQALLDVKDATATTAENTDPLKSLGGTLAFEFGGSRLTDDLLSSGVGA